MRIFKALDLIPQSVHLGKAVGSDFLKAWQLVNQLAVLKNGNLQFSGREIVDPLGLPGGVRVEDRHVFAVVHHLVVNRQIVGNGLAGVLGVETVQLLVVGIGDFLHVFGNFDLGNHRAILRNEARHHGTDMSRLIIPEDGESITLK